MFRAPPMRRWLTEAHAAVDFPGALRATMHQHHGISREDEVDRVAARHVERLLAHDEAGEALVDYAGRSFPLDSRPARVVCTRTTEQRSVTPLYATAHARHHQAPGFQNTIAALLQVPEERATPALALAIALGGPDDPTLLADRIPGDGSDPPAIALALLAANSRCAAATFTSLQRRGICTPLTTMMALEAGYVDEPALLSPHTVGYALKLHLWQRLQYERPGVGWWDQSYDFRWRDAYDALPDLLTCTAVILADGQPSRRRSLLSGLGCGPDGTRTRDWLANTCVSLLTHDVPALSASALHVLAHVDAIGR